MMQDDGGWPFMRMTFMQPPERGAIFGLFLGKLVYAGYIL
jgi:hypothetical protein